jgi:hypothetical protein
MKTLPLALAAVLLASPAFAASSLYFNASGDVGVNTGSPVNALDVNGAAAIGSGYAATDTAQQTA